MTMQGPMIVMCRRARGCDDPKHQPTEDFFFGAGPLWCTCGEQVDEQAGVKALPAF
jgi:hypothetical protein